MLFLIITFSSFAQCPSAGPDATACGQTTQLHSLGATGYWSGPAGAIYTPSGTDPNANVFIPAYTGVSYQATYTWNESGCTPADDVIITFMKPPHAEAGPNQNVCGTTMQLDADTIGTGIINAYWTSSVPGVLITPSGTDPIPWNPIADVSVLGSGFWINSQRAVWFYWHGQNSLGCISIDSVLVTFYQKPDAYGGKDTAICGKSHNLDGSWNIATHSGIWTMSTTPPNPGSANFIPQTSPTATVTVTNFGYYNFIWKEMNINNTTCFDRDTVRVEFKVVPMPDAGLDISVAGNWAYICATPSVPGGSWYGPAGGIVYYDAQNGNITPLNQFQPCTWIYNSSQNNTVIVYWIENNGVCVGWDSLSVHFNNAQYIFNVDNVTNSNNLSIYPNPFTDNCNIQFYLQESSPVMIEIYDLLGNKVATLCNETMQQGNHTINYSFQNNNAEQFYLIRMVTNEGQSVKRVIKL